MKAPHLAASGLLALCAALPAAAHDLVFTADLLGSSESVPNDSPGFGSTTITLNEHALTMRVQASFSGLVGTVNFTHIHCCTAQPGTGNAGVATPMPSFEGFPSGVTSGTYDRTFDMTQVASWNSGFISTHGGTVDSAFQALQAGLGEGKAYFNIHTSAFGGGELRGNLVAASAVPEPQSLALMLAGLLGLGVVLRKNADQGA